MPDETELVKAGMEGAAKGTADSILEPFKALVGEFCHEVGEGFGYYGRLFRLKMGLRVMMKAKKMLEDARIDHALVAPKLFVPIIENASLEDDETLQEEWAALLANAANPGSRVKVHPTFSGILKNLTPEEATLLKSIYLYVCNELESKALPPQPVHSPNIELANAIKGYGTFHALDASEVQPMVENLQALGLIRFTGGALMTSEGDFVFRPNVPDLYMTALGFEFVTACQPPASSANLRS